MQIRASPQAKAFFRQCCKEEGIPIRELIKWVRTRWGSMHDLVERLIECRKVLTFRWTNVQKLISFAGYYEVLLSGR